MGSVERRVTFNLSPNVNPCEFVGGPELLPKIRAEVYMIFGPGGPVAFCVDEGAW